MGRNHDKRLRLSGKAWRWPLLSGPCPYRRERRAGFFATCVALVPGFSSRGEGTLSDAANLALVRLEQPGQNIAQQPA